MSEQRGTVATASYEAHKFGIDSAMFARRARQLYLHLIIVPPRFEAHRTISAQIRRIFYGYTDLIEPAALDEVYMGVIESDVDIPSATWSAQAIQTSIYEETDLTASVGVSIDKFLAKIVSGMKKPNRSSLIALSEAEAFAEQLPIDQFHSVGRVSAVKIYQLGVMNLFGYIPRPLW